MAALARRRRGLCDRRGRGPARAVCDEGRQLVHRLTLRIDLDGTAAYDFYCGKDLEGAHSAGVAKRCSASESTRASLFERSRRRLPATSIGCVGRIFPRRRPDHLRRARAHSLSARICPFTAVTPWWG